MLPVIALIGRPNVGKSTIFNRLTRTRDAIVADIPGVTRDRQCGYGRLGEHPFLVVDTGGFGAMSEAIDTPMLAQMYAAIHEATIVFFIVDAQTGLTAGDLELAAILRQAEKPITLVINKSEGLDVDIKCTEFFQLGFKEYAYISAAHNQGLYELVSTTLAPETETQTDIESEMMDVEVDKRTRPIKVAIVGRPNVGKSTLTNRLLGEERVVVFDQPGTTRDSIHIPFQLYDKHYILIDTAGVRRRSRIDDRLEKFSVIKTLQAIQEADIIIVLLNARDGIGEQDLRLLGHVLQAGRSFLIAINQWDGLSPDQRQRVKAELDRRLDFVPYAEQFFISAKHGTGVGLLLPAVNKIYKAITQDLPSSFLTKCLETAVERFPPPLVRGRRIKLRFAHPVGQVPPTIKIHGNQTSHLPESYHRYLMNYFRTTLKMVGTPIVLQFADSVNPFKEQRNKPSERQIKKKHRLIKHVKKSKK